MIIKLIWFLVYGARRLLLFSATIALLVLPILAKAETNSPDCLSQDLPAKEVFSLSINMTFSGKIEFYLCNEQDSDKSFLLSRKQVNQNTFSTIKTLLTKKQQKDISALYRQALKFNIMHDERALTLDGSTWCLKKYRGYLNFTACFWSPKEDMQIRKTTGLISLGKSLLVISGLDKEFNDLY
jgi:hypothetical protein